MTGRQCQVEAHVAPRWHVRPMRVADLPAITRIELRIFAAPWTHGNFADSLAAGYDGWVFSDPFDSSAILGYSLLMWTPDEVHLLNLSVNDSVQGRGLGTQFMDWILSNLLHRGAQSILLEVRPSNLAALRLYERMGFHRIGLRKGYYPPQEGVREDAIVMVRRLDALSAPNP